MKLKKVTTISVALTLLTLSAVGLGLANFNDGNVNVAKAEEVATTDYNAFEIRAGSAGSVTADTTNNSITYTGGWGGNVAVSDQFNTRAGNYSLKAHVYKEGLEAASDTGIGFTIYYNDSNFITFYLKWLNCDGFSSPIMNEANFHTRVNDSWTNNHQYAQLPDGAFTNNGEWIDIWSDGMWKTGVNEGASINLRTGSKLFIGTGFDMTMHVERTTYNERAVDVIYMQVDTVADDGVTPLTAYTPKYATDAFTNPFGNGESAFINRKPQIGFTSFNLEDIVISDIVFTDKTNTTIDLGINRVGLAPKTATIDAATNSIKYNNGMFGTGFLLAEKDITSTESFDLQATVAGTAGNANDTQIGFVYYLDSSNYVMIYLKWDGGVSTVAEVCYLFTVGGKTNSVTQAAREEWDDSYTTVGEFYDGWTDFNGWITDGIKPENSYGNFNHVRDNSAVTISSGFTMGIQRRRITYSGRVADAFQVRFTAKGLDNITHTWYSSTLCADAYTYPNGATEASALINKNAQMGFYAYQTNEVALSDVRVNGVKANLKAGTLENARTEATNFMNTYMHLSDYDTALDNSEGTGACAGESGYYKAAKEAWNNLSDNAKEVFMSEGEYANGYARLLAWATANGDTLDSNNSLTTSGINMNSIIHNTNNMTALVVIISAVVIVSFALVGSIIYHRKRKVSK